MAITTENFSAAISGWTTVRGSVALARVAADNSGSIASETNGNARRDFDTGSADMFTEVDVVAAGADANRTIFLMARCTSAGGANSTTAQNYYAGALNANAGTLSVLRYTNGAATALVSGLSVSVPATPFKYRIEVEGSTVRVFIGGTQVWSGTDTSITSGTRGGVGFYNAGTTPVARIDNFRTGALADDRTVVHDAAVPLSGGGALGANATATRPAAVAMSGGGSLGTAAAQQHRAAVSMSGGGQLAASAGVARPAAAALSGGGELTTAATPARAAVAALSGGGALGVTAGQVASVALSGGGQLTTAAQQGHRNAAALSAGGALTTAAGQGHRAAVALAGGGALAAAGTRALPVAAPLTGGGSLAVSGTRVKVASAALAGGGELGTGAPVRAAVTGTLLTGGGRLTARANSTAGGALNPSLWARDPATDRWVQLPHVIDLSVTDVENDVGAVSCEYPAFGWRSDLLRTYVTDTRDLEVEVWLEGSRASRMVGWLKQRQGDDVSEEALWSFSGVLVTARLDEGVIEPQPLVGETTLGPDVEVARSSVTAAQWSRLYALGYRTSEGTPDKVRVPQKVLDAVKANRTDIPRLADPKREARFVAATPGAIMLFLLGQCWARGALTDLTVDFTATHDSSGVAWPEVLTAKWSPHVTLLQVAQRLAELTLAEFTVSPDRVVRMWRFGGRGTNRSAGERPVTLRRGHNLLEAGRRQGSRDAGTDFYVAGGEGQFTKATDANARARFGRVIERAVSVGNIEDAGALTAAAQRARDAGVRGEDERTFSLALGVGMPRPGRTLGVGDTARVDTSGTLGTARLAQWHVGYGVGGVVAEITTGDLIRSRAAGLLKRLAEQQSGDTIVGTSQPSEDRGVPAAPTGLVVHSRAYTEGTDAYAAVTAGCAPVEVNTDGTAATDLDSYEWQWRLESEPDLWQAGATTTGPTGSWTTGIAQPIRVRVRAKDRTGNRSEWSTEYQHLTDDAVTPPPVPSGLTGEAWLGNSIRWRWDGLTADGGDMLAVFPRFDHVELRMGTSGEFADSSYVVSLYAGQPWTVNNLPDGVGQYAWLVAVERSGLRSGPSARAFATPRRLVSLDFGPDSVDRAAIKALAVGTLELDDGAVNSLKVTELSVALLTGGVMSADVIVGGSFLTGTTGRRLRFGAEGLQMWNASEQVVVAFRTADGSSLVTGQQQSALSGKRIVINWGSSNPDEIRFYGSNTNQYAALRTVASTSENYPDQTGVTIRAFSSRSDGFSGRLNLFPDYSSLEWGVTYLQCVPHQLGVRAARVHVGLPRGSDATIPGSDDEKFRIGVSSLSSGEYIQKTVLTYMLNSVDEPAWMNYNLGSGIIFGPGHTGSVRGDFAGYNPFRASAFTQMTSLRSTKQDFAPLDYEGGPLGALRRAPVEMWRRITEVEIDGDLAEMHIGPMADDLPPEVVRFDIGPGGATGYDVDSHLGLVHAGVNQLADVVDQLIARIDRLEEARV